MIIKYIKTIVFKIAISIIRKLRKLSLSHKLSVLILPASSPGSLGDEAMLIGLLSEVQQTNVERIGLVTYKTDDKWINISNVDEVICLPQRRYEWISFLKKISTYSHLFINGADVLDGHYSVAKSIRRIRVASIAAKIGLKTTVTGFSFRDNASIEVIEELQRLPNSVRLCVRDPVSYRRLTANIKSELDLVADLAFLLKPEKTSIYYKFKKIISECYVDGRIVIGINFNRQVLQSMDEQLVIELQNTYIYVICELYKWNKNIFFVLIPHDFRGDQSDFIKNEEIYSLLPGAVKSNCTYVDEVINSKEVKALVSLMDVVFSGRMHLAIACLGQGVPVGCLGYQGKFEGLYEHFCLEDSIISPDNFIENKETALGFLKMLIMNRDKTRNNIKEQLCKVQRLSKDNFNIN